MEFLKSIKDSLISRMRGKVKRYPIIIGGFYRSGTSLLRRLLDSHPNIHCPPEIKFFRDFYGDYLSDDLKHLRFFSTLRSIRLGEDRLIEIFGKAFIECHEEAAYKAGKSRWADKNPENVLYLEQWKKLLNGRFFFIHVVRHPLDTITSLNEAGFPRTIPSEFRDKVLLYNEYLERAFVFMKTHDRFSITLRYEDMVSRSRESLTSLLNFLEEECNEEILNIMFREFCSPSRGYGLEDPKVDKVKVIHSKSIGRWEKELGTEYTKMANRYLGKWFSILGYE